MSTLLRDRYARGRKKSIADYWDDLGICAHRICLACCWTGQRTRRYQATRSFWTVLYGHAPAADQEIAHLCDNPPCANPLHLVQITHTTNMCQLGEQVRRLNLGLPLPSTVEKVLARPDLEQVWRQVLYVTRYRTIPRQVLEGVLESDLRADPGPHGQDLTADHTRGPEVISGPHGYHMGEES